MRVVNSNKFENEIIVDIENDTNTNYLWKWGTYEQIGDTSRYVVTPPTEGKITFQSALRCLVSVANS